VNAPFHFFHFAAPPLSPPENSALSFRIVLLSSELGKSPSFETLERDLGFPRHRQRLSLPLSFLFGLRQAKQANVVSLTNSAPVSEDKLVQLETQPPNSQRNVVDRCGEQRKHRSNLSSFCLSSRTPVIRHWVGVGLWYHTGEDFRSFLEGRHIYHLAPRSSHLSSLVESSRVLCL
jgi:hypothetical protein